MALLLPKAVVKSFSILTDSQKELCTKLYCELGQDHLFDCFESATPPSVRRTLASHLEELDMAYKDGGLEGYIANARKLLEDSRNGVNPLEGWKPSVPQGQMFELGTPEYKETEAKGLKQLGSVGFVLVAGGLGERLGYSGIKIGLPTDLTSNTSYIQHYIEYILAVQKKYAPANRKLPLCIMTSGDTNARTVELLEAHHYFGMDKAQVTIVQQGLGVPALSNNEAAIVLETASRIQTKPHGHGDIHELLHSHGVAKKWKEAGIGWITLFQDTNGLAFHTLPLMLGVSVKMDLLMNSLTVPRKAKQAVGGIMKLTNKNTRGETRTINVEYNQLDPLLRASGFTEGDVNDEKTGYSPYPGNINQLLFKLDGYVRVLERTKGLMPEFVNPKYTDDTKTVFKKATRLECMMQDFPMSLDADESKHVGFTSIAASMCFSPVKNAAEDGVLLQQKGTHSGTAASGEADMYAANRKILNSLGCSVDEANLQVYKGIAVHPGAAIVLKPDFACCPAEFEEKFPLPTAVKISARSTLFVRGSGVIIESLDLDGTLIIDYKDGENITIRDKVVSNAGWVRIVDEDSTDEVTKMRGYRIEQKQSERLQPKSCVIL